MRRVRASVADPSHGAHWLDYARYVARVASIAPVTATAGELRRAAADICPARSTPEQKILHALDGAGEGRRFAPTEAWG